MDQYYSSRSTYLSFHKESIFLSIATRITFPWVCNNLTKRLSIPTIIAAIPYLSVDRNAFLIPNFENLSLCSYRESAAILFRASPPSLLHAVDTGSGGQYFSFPRPSHRRRLRFMYVFHSMGSADTTFNAT